MSFAQVGRVALMYFVLVVLLMLLITHRLEPRKLVLSGVMCLLLAILSCAPKAPKRRGPGK